jgi:hypothetical protein
MLVTRKKFEEHLRQAARSVESIGHQLRYLQAAHVRNRVKLLGLANHLGVEIEHADDYRSDVPTYVYKAKKKARGRARAARRRHSK